MIETRIISDEQVLHRSEEQGPRIGRIIKAVVTIDGVDHETVTRYWYDWGTGEPLYIR